MGSQNTAKHFYLFTCYFPPSILTVSSVGTVADIHNHFTSADRAPPWRYGWASHHSLTISSSCWPATMPEDMRQPDIGTGRYAHKYIHCAAGAGCTRGCQSLLLCFYSLTCLIQSKTVSKSGRKRKAGKKRRKERLPLSFHWYDSSHAAAPKVKLPFSLW